MEFITEGLTIFGELLDTLRLNNYSDIEISQFVEDKLKQENFKGTLYFIENEIPLFINSNWRTIENSVLNTEGKIKFSICEKPKLPNFLLKNSENLSKIEIYKRTKIISQEHALFGNLFETYSKNNKFYLNHFVHPKCLENYNSFFEKAKDKFEKIDLQSCFTIK
jgi:hypothetical protein